MIMGIYIVTNTIFYQKNMKKLIVLILTFISLNAFGQYIESNNYFSITFPNKPESFLYPGDANGTVYQYTKNGEYTIQLIQISTPEIYQREIMNSDIESLALTFLGNYLNTVGGGVLISKELIKFQNYNAIQFLYTLNSSLSLYRKAKMFFCCTKSNFYIICFYFNQKNIAYNDYIKTFNIKK